MIETALLAFTTLFTTVAPVDVAALFAVLTPKASAKHRRAMAVKGTLLATGILLVFALLGRNALEALGITLPAMRTAGGILLLLIAMDMVFARTSGGVTTTEDEDAEAERKKDISVFPLATPLIAGPGAMGAVILLMGNASGSHVSQAIVVGAILAVMAITFVLLLMAGGVQRVLGVTGLNVITRVMGVLLAALAVQFIFDGIAASGLFSR